MTMGILEKKGYWWGAAVSSFTWEEILGSFFGSVWPPGRRVVPPVLPTTAIMSLSSFQKSASEVLQACKGNDISHVPTPHLIIDRRVYVNNCERMADAVEKLGWSFRAHIKTHKTVPGTKLQCETTRTGMIIASTIPEMWDC